MINALKQIFSFILPVTVLIIVPWWIEKDLAVRLNIQFAAGAFVMLCGLTIMAVTISSFMRIGKGTLAPWSPPKRLVIRGLYRYVRNPMILGVITVLLSEALAFRSRNILEWAAGFLVINTIYFVVYEEPDLETRFGKDYRDYKKQVRRWLPRQTPYSPNETRNL